MRIKLEVHHIIDGSRGMQAGSFDVRYKEDIPNLAFQWIKRIKFETGYRKTIIEKVIWNNEHDITQEVIALIKAPLPDDNLPF